MVSSTIDRVYSSRDFLLVQKSSKALFSFHNWWTLFDFHWDFFWDLFSFLGDASLFRPEAFSVAPILAVALDWENSNSHNKQDFTTCGHSPHDEAWWAPQFTEELRSKFSKLCQNETLTGRQFSMFAASMITSSFKTKDCEITKEDCSPSRNLLNFGNLSQFSILSLTWDRAGGG